MKVMLNGVLTERPVLCMNVVEEEGAAATRPGVYREIPVTYPGERIVWTLASTTPIIVTEQVE